jgi:REP element-mobilizing transposase RayT
MPSFDYGQAAIWFVTICLRNMADMRFGGVNDGQLMVNQAGMMIGEVWFANIERYSGASLDAFVVMPNLLHGIVLIGTEPGAPAANLNDIVATFKSISSAEYGRGVREGTFPSYESSLWQRSFYDRMIRNETDLDRARAYIEGNPARWIEKFQTTQRTP